MCHNSGTNRAQDRNGNKPGQPQEKWRSVASKLLDQLSHSPLTLELKARFETVVSVRGVEKANEELQTILDSLVIGELNLTDSPAQLRDFAKQLAKRCETVRNQSDDISLSFQQCAAIVEQYRLIPPKLRPEYLDADINRMCCGHWWNRKIQILKLRTLEKISRNIQLVNKTRSIYASDYTVELKRIQNAKNREYLSSTFITNESGQSYNLQELADLSVSNPEIRRAELMVRARGFEEVAGLVGHIGEFYTITTPSRMHACHHDGRANPNHDGSSPREVHQYLAHLWTLVRAELHRQGIRPYGFRVVEPHHDGTPHWHLLLFMPPAHRNQIREVIRSYALADSGDEPGALKHRFQAVAIDPAKGSAAGYIAKYISKNINGYGLDKDEEGNTSSEAAEHIIAWARTWGIRQFQQIGGPSVSVWRQLRKMASTDDEELESIRLAATASDWAAYTLAMGGPQIPRREHPTKTHYALTQQLNPNTGQIIINHQGQYGDPAGLRVAGLIWRGQTYDTRTHFWTVSRGGGECIQVGCATLGPHRPEYTQFPFLDLYQ